MHGIRPETSAQPWRGDRNGLWTSIFRPAGALLMQCPIRGLTPPASSLPPLRSSVSKRCNRVSRKYLSNPHFSPAFYCGGGSGHVYCVALGRAPRRTVEYACGALGRAPCIHTRLHRLATKSGEKCGLSAILAYLRCGGAGIRAAFHPKDFAPWRLSLPHRQDAKARRL